MQDETAQTQDPTVARVLSTWAPRMLVQGVDYNDLVDTSARINQWDDWLREWSLTAAEHEARAVQHEERGESVSASDAWFQAAITYHFACNNFPHDLEQYLPVHEKRTDCYRRAAVGFDPAAQRHDVPFEATTLPGYLRVPETDGPVPVVVIVSGLESTKEEQRTMEEVFLRRGMATFSFDGPGQGEAWADGGMRIEFEHAVSAVIDHLAGLGSLDDTVGLFGPSMGGYLAARAAATDGRIAAIAVSGACYDRRRYAESLDDPFDYARNAHIWKEWDKERLADLLRRATLEGMAERITSPLLIVAGTRDFVPLAEPERIYAEASGPKHLVVVEGGNHVCNNRPHVYRPLVGDFLASHLLGP